MTPKDIVRALNKHVRVHPGDWAERRVAMDYITKVIATAVSSAFVESLFSIMAYGTGGHRASTKMETFAPVLHLRSTPDLSAGASDAAVAGHFAPKIAGV